MTQYMTRLLIIALTAGLFLASWLWSIPKRTHSSYLLDNIIDSGLPPSQSTHWVSGNDTAETHSASLGLHDDTPVAVWYGGTEEGHADVALFFASFDEGWSTPKRVMDRAESEQELSRFIRKVGNPAIHVWDDGAIGIFFVTVSVGGWAASSINYIESVDGGDSWSETRRLVTSPFLNLSTLVRTSALELADGTIQLPVYHEFMGKFSEVLHLDRELNVLNKSRLSHGKHSLQPAIAATSENSAVALLRYSGDPPNRILQTSTSDTGLHWRQTTRMDLPNPDAAVALLRLDEDEFLLALNDLEDGRYRLSLAIGTADDFFDGAEGSFNIVRTVESEEPSEPGSHEFEFSYPSLMADPSGKIHLIYTWNQTRIRHLIFNRQWLTGV